MTFAIVAMALAGWRYGPPAWQQAQALYWQRQCMRFQLPPEQIVYDEDPAGMAVLLRNGEYGYLADTGTIFAKRRSVVLRLIAAAGCQPDCYRAFTGGRAGAAVVFLHERVSKAGKPRLVVVQLAPSIYNESGFDPDWSFRIQTYTLAGWRTGATPTSLKWHSYTLPDGPDGQPTARVWAGQADPLDPSHFVIHYRAYGRDHVADGWLNDDGDDVNWHIRPMPTVRPTTRG